MFILKHFADAEFDTSSVCSIQFDSNVSKLGHLRIIFPLKLAVNAGNGRMRSVFFW